MIRTSPKLLVSVVSPTETLAALEGEADIIDLKNPLEGALGAPSPEIIAQVAAELKGKKPFSIALGEFPRTPSAAALAALGSALFKPGYLKIAFIPDSLGQEIIKTLGLIKKSLNYSPNKTQTSIVSVVYADLLKDASWNLSEFISFTQVSGAEGCLIDTWEKNGRSLLEYLDGEVLTQFVDNCHKNGLFCGLAGSLKEVDIFSICKLKPDIIGVRSVVCQGDRINGRLSAQKVKEIKEVIDRGVIN
ncbi:MAG: hypothetical protein APF84_01425 [Gracilibacter sp. BRH_c7a]|nr:MAG: hypothetical protein APF84_01425 [Gracilibacter sp. BRH_c7a]